MRARPAPTRRTSPRRPARYGGAVSSMASAPPRGAVLAAGALAALAVSAPSAGAQFRPSPWATINACDPPAAPGSVGVRVAVPNRGDAAQWIRIRIQFFDGTRASWRVVRSGGDGGFTKLSDGGGRGVGGAELTFKPPAARKHLELPGA